MKSQPTRLVLLVLPAVIIALVSGLSPVLDWDYWWHLTMGRLVEDFARLPAHNHFVYTVDADAPSFILPWFSQWTMYLVHDLGGLELAVILRSVLGAASLLVVTWVAARRADSVVAASGLALFAGLVGWWTGALELGPMLFAIPMYVVLLAVGFAIHERRWPSWMAAVFPLLAAGWVHVHVSFLIPALLAVAFLIATLVDRSQRGEAGSRARIIGWSLALVGTLLAPLTHPRRAEVFGHAISNWPILHPDTLIWLLLAAPIIAAPWVARIGAMARLEALAKRRFAASYLVLVVVLGLAVALQPLGEWQTDLVADLHGDTVRESYPLKGRVAATAPVECVEALRLQGSKPRVFHAPEHAGFILFHMQDTSPQPMVWSDPRAGLVPDAVHELHGAMVATPSVARGVFQQYGIRAVVADATAHGDLVRELREDRGWYVVYEDELGVCLVRRG